MPYDRTRHHRRSIRLRGYDYASSGMYFVTICVQDRVCHLGHIANGEVVLSRAGEIAERCWRGIPDHFPHVTLDAYVVMPNHVHGIIVIDHSAEPIGGDGSPSVVGAQHAAPLQRRAVDAATPRRVTSGSLGAIVRSFKAAVTREINAMDETPSTPFWQRNYWEHIIRNSDEYQRIATYIVSNPALWPDDQLYMPEREES